MDSKTDSNSENQRKTVRVFICDDYPVVLQGLTQIISRAAGMEVCGEAGTGKELLQSIDRQSVDVLVLDICLPDISAFQLLNELRTKYPNIPIIVLSIYPEDYFASRCLKAGASGYLPKASSPEQLVDAIRKIAEGGIFVSPELGERLAYDLKAGMRVPHETLSEREFQVFCRSSKARH